MLENPPYTSHFSLLSPPSSSTPVSPRVSFHRIIGQIPRFDVATKSQNNETSFDHERLLDSSRAWLEFNPLRYNTSNASFTSLRNAGPNPARRSPTILIVETPSLPMAIENGGTSLPTPEIPCSSEIVPILVN